MENVVVERDRKPRDRQHEWRELDPQRQVLRHRQMSVACNCGDRPMPERGRPFAYKVAAKDEPGYHRAGCQHGQRR